MLHEVRCTAQALHATGRSIRVEWSRYDSPQAQFVDLLHITFDGSVLRASDELSCAGVEIG